MLINSPNISGSLKVTGNTVITGSLTVLGGINATITGSATSASYVEYSNVANKPALVSGSSQVTYSGLTGVPSGIVSGSSQITYSGISSIPSGIVSSSTQITGYNIFATTGSNQFNGSQAITGSLTVTGQVVAQTLNVQQVTSSIVYSSGSNIFGNSLGNTQQFTGSVSVTGSLMVNGVNYLPLTGGTLTGALSGTSATFSGLVTTNDNLRALQTTTSANSQIIADSDNGSTLRAAIITFGSTASDSLLGILRASNSMLYKDGGKLAIGTRSAQDLVLSTNDTIRLTITSTGTATFSSSVTAQSMKIENTAAPAFLYFNNTSAPATNYIALGSGANELYFHVNGSDRMLIKNNGNIGIGTPDPQYKLDIYSSTSPATIGLKSDGTYNSIIRDYTAQTDSTLDITTERTDGGGFNFLLLVSSTLTASGANRNYYTFAVAGRGTSATSTQLSNVSAGTSSRTAIAVSFPSNGVIRLTLTGGETCQIKVTAIGHGSL
jgi:hypothetical protein